MAATQVYIRQLYKNSKNVLRSVFLPKQCIQHKVSSIITIQPFCPLLHLIRHLKVRHFLLMPIVRIIISPVELNLSRVPTARLTYGSKVIFSNPFRQSERMQKDALIILLLFFTGIFPVLPRWCIIVPLVRLVWALIITIRMRIHFHFFSISDILFLISVRSTKDLQKKAALSGSVKIHLH